MFVNKFVGFLIVWLTQIKMKKLKKLDYFIFETEQDDISQHIITFSIPQKVLLFLKRNVYSQII